MKINEFVNIGEKPYKCNTCDYAGYLSERLNNHKTVHSGECEASFAQRDE